MKTDMKSKECNKIRRSKGDCRIRTRNTNLKYYKCNICGCWHIDDSKETINDTIEIKE